MYEIKVAIKGIAPLLINRFLADQKSGKKSVEELRAEAIKKLHFDEDGNCCVTAEMIKSSLVYGSNMAGIKEGRKSIGQFLKATVFVEPKNILLGKTKPDFIDERAGRIPPRTGSVVMLYRGGFNQGWEVNFKFLVTDDKRTVENIKNSLIAAGTLTGIGSGRPDNGRFIITKWEVSNGRKS